MRQREREMAYQNVSDLAFSATLQAERWKMEQSVKWEYVTEVTEVLSHVPVSQHAAAVDDL